MNLTSASIRRRRRIGLLLGTALAGGTAAVIALTAALPAQAATALKTLAEAKGRYFGTALTQSDLSNGTLTGVAAAQFDMVTPGNEMKWDTTERSQGSFNFGPGDAIVSFAQSHGMRVRGHNLVWHSQLPSWVSSLPLSQVQGVMQNHITTEATHYKGKVYAWDVINEPYNEDGSLRQDVFYQAMGSGYLATAIRTAHSADPSAVLYINDYNIEGVNAKSNALYSLAQSMLAQGVPLGGIGLESHFIVGQVPSSLLTNMQRFANLGLDVAITELDDRIPLPASSANLQQQGTDYGTVVKDCVAVARCVGVSQWGVDDGHSWINGTFSGYGAATMYDSSYQPKAAYNAAVSALSSAPTTPPTTGTTVGCTATYQLVNSWPGGLQANVVVTNTGSATINSWSVHLTLPSGQTISSLWSGVNSGTSGSITVTNAAYNGTLAPAASTSFGYTTVGANISAATAISCAGTR